MDTTSEQKLKLCLCGNPGVKRTSTGDVCQRCLDLESGAKSRERREAKARKAAMAVR